MLRFNHFQGVSLCDINEKDGKETTKELQREHGKDRIMFIKMDVADENEFKGKIDLIYVIISTVNIL